MKKIKVLSLQNIFSSTGKYAFINYDFFIRRKYLKSEIGYKHMKQSQWNMILGKAWSFLTTEDAWPVNISYSWSNIDVQNYTWAMVTNFTAFLGHFYPVPPTVWNVLRFRFVIINQRFININEKSKNGGFLLRTKHWSEIFKCLSGQRLIAAYRHQNVYVKCCGYALPFPWHSLKVNGPSFGFYL